jgi:hypothetical protein
MSRQPAFHLSPGAPIAGTSGLTEAELVPAHIVARFGRGRPTADAKCSGTYAFQDDNGNVFTLYDWKCTSLWEIAEGHAPDEKSASFPTPDEFWALDFPVPLNIGGHRDCGDLEAFIAFLRQPPST